MDVGTDVDWLTAQVVALAKCADQGSLFDDGLTLLRRFHDSGGTQQAAYDALHRLHLAYRDTDEAKMDFVDDLLDCVVGWVGNPDWAVWRGQHLS